MPLSAPEDDSLEGLGLAFSGLSVGGPEGKKEKEMEKEAVDKDIEEEHPGDETPFEHKPLECAERQPLNTLQYPLPQPLHSQPHIQLHPHPQPLHLWLRD